MDEMKLGLDAAWAAAKSSPCEKKKVGAVLIDHDGLILGRGYGGDAGGKCTCSEAAKYEWHFDKSYSIHAEMRAIFMAIGDLLFDLGLCTMYITHGPCDQCMKYMDYFGIRKIVFDKPYKGDDYTKWKGRGMEVWRRDERLI